jgi:DGQHR domain-containing protein
MSRLSFTASLVTQGRHRFYTLTMTSDVLARTCFVINRDEDPIEGFQRLLDKNRAQQIADYIDAGLGTVPTSIVLSAQPVADFRYERKSRTVSFKDDSKAFLILDGQHRVWGFALAKSALRVPVVIYNELSRTDESRLFIDINTKQRPVPNELLLDIRKLAEYQDDVETRLGQIFDIYNADNRSPLLGLLTPSKKKTDHISRVTFNAALKPHLDAFADFSPKEIFEITAAYLSAFINVSKSNGLELKITSPILFRAIFWVFTEVAQRVQDKFGKEYTVQNFESVLSPMLSTIKASILKNPGSSVTALAKIFSDALKSKFIL